MPPEITLGVAVVLLLAVVTDDAVRPRGAELLHQGAHWARATLDGHLDLYAGVFFGVIVALIVISMAFAASWRAEDEAKPRFDIR